MTTEDPQARLRAQRAKEDKALSAYTAAVNKRDAAIKKRDELLAREEAKVAEADVVVDTAIAQVVDAVGGQDRAATILALSIGAIRKAMQVSSEKGDEPQTAGSPTVARVDAFAGTNPDSTPSEAVAS